MAVTRRSLPAFFRSLRWPIAIIPAPADRGAFPSASALRYAITSARWRAFSIPGKVMVVSGTTACGREPSVERRRVPGRPGVLEGVRVARESGDRAGAPVPDRREAGPGEVNAGLDRMTGRALLEEGSAASRIAARCVSRRVCRRPTHEYEHQKDRRKDDGENDGYGWRSSHFHESYFSASRRRRFAFSFSTASTSVAR